MIKRLIYSILLMLFGLLLLGPMLHSAFAHYAPSGWQYPTDCCNGGDCKPTRIDEVEGGYYIPEADQFIPYGDKRIRLSGDSETHSCGYYHKVLGIIKYVARCIYLSLSY